jgi:hypothetical protein
MFHDYMANFRECFMLKVDAYFVLCTELIAMIIAMELVHSKNQRVGRIFGLKVIRKQPLVPWTIILLFRGT